MNDKQVHEIAFWKQIYSEKENYRSFRKEDGAWKMTHFPDLPNRNGIGLDVGCGLVSVFDGLDNKIVAIDPLMDEYRNIDELVDTKNITYKKMSGEQIDYHDNHFDYAFCVNVIDHTPSPEIMALEIHRVLKKGGRLYFEVNFDDDLSPCHYALWDEKKVKTYLKPFKLVSKVLERNDKDRQYLYHAIYEKV